MSTLSCEITLKFRAAISLGAGEGLAVALCRFEAAVAALPVRFKVAAPDVGPLLMTAFVGAALLSRLGAGAGARMDATADGLINMPKPCSQSK